MKMNFKNYLNSFIEKKSLNNEENKKDILTKSIKMFSKHIEHKKSISNYEDLLDEFRNFIKILNDNNILEDLDFYKISHVLNENDLKARFDYRHTENKLKIIGNKEFFLHLSKLFNGAVKKNKLVQKIEDKQNEKDQIEFSIKLNKKNSFGYLRNIRDIENIIAVQFINWLPGDSHGNSGVSLSVRKIYSIVDMYSFKISEMDDYDFVKFSTNGDQKFWGFSIYDDNYDKIKFTADFNDNDLIFLTKKDIKQIRNY